jgi:hypothetical protein
MKFARLVLIGVLGAIVVAAGGLVLTEAKAPDASSAPTLTCGLEGACGGGCGGPGAPEEGGCAADKAIAEKAEKADCDGDCEVCDECDKHPDCDGDCEDCDKCAKDEKCSDDCKCEDCDCEDCASAESCDIEKGCPVTAAAKDKPAADKAAKPAKDKPSEAKKPKPE